MAKWRIFAIWSFCRWVWFAKWSDGAMTVEHGPFITWSDAVKSVQRPRAR